MKNITLAKYLCNGSLHILMVRDRGGDDYRMSELYLHPLEQLDRRHMAMRLRQARQFLFKPAPQPGQQRLFT